jgi:hypothetical protein
MDAPIAFLIAVAVLVILDIAAISLGAESRDGFADDRIDTSLR